MKTLAMALSAILAMAVPAMATECMQDSLTSLFDISDYNFGNKYTCSVTTDNIYTDEYFFVVPQGTTIPELFKSLVNATSIVGLVEEITGQKCIQIDNQKNGELRRIVCQPNK